MGTIEKRISRIPVAEVKGIDTMFGRQMKLDMKNIPLKYKAVFDETRNDAFQTMEINCIFESYEIDRLEGDRILLKGGTALESSMLAKAFRRSKELAFYVVSTVGYEALDEAVENMAIKLFLDSWGTAFVECSSIHLKKSLAEDLKKHGIYTTFAFSPGQHNVSMELQKVIFALLQPEAIGVTLNEHFLMHPKKSVSGIFGIGPEKDDDGMKPCDFCDLRDTCSSAYAGNVVENA